MVAREFTLGPTQGTHASPVVGPGWMQLDVIREAGTSSARDVPHRVDPDGTAAGACFRNAAESRGHHIPAPRRADQVAEPVTLPPKNVLHNRVAMDYVEQGHGQQDRSPKSGPCWKYGCDRVLNRKLPSRFAPGYLPHLRAGRHRAAEREKQIDAPTAPIWTEVCAIAGWAHSATWSEA